MNKLFASVLISQFYFGCANICCPEKKVGDKTYQLREEGDTTQFNCMDGCIYSMEGDNQNKRFCFRSGSLPVDCQNNYDVTGYIYHKPSLILNMSSDGPGHSGEVTQSVDTWKDGFATEVSACASATKGAFITIKFVIKIKGVSSAKIKTNNLKLVRLIKEEYKEEFTESIEASADISIWGWLGIKSNGVRTDTERKFFSEGQKGLDEARDEVAQDLENNLNQDVRITAEASVEGQGFFPARACIYFAVQQVKLSNGDTVNIAVSDDEDWETADEKSGNAVRNKGINGNVFDLGN